MRYAGKRNRRSFTRLLIQVGQTISEQAHRKSRLAKPSGKYRPAQTCHIVDSLPAKGWCLKYPSRRIRSTMLFIVESIVESIVYRLSSSRPCSGTIASGVTPQATSIKLAQLEPTYMCSLLCNRLSIPAQVAQRNSCHCTQV